MGTWSFLGIDGRTGAYVRPPVEMPGGMPPISVQRKDRFRGTVHGVDHTSPTAAGWGLIVPSEGGGRLRQALEPLVEHRRTQAREQGLEALVHDDLTYEAGTSALRFKELHGVGPGPVDPARGLPYYLVLAGGPARIPYDFEFDLNGSHAVGRISFATVAEYRSYAERVVAAERAARPCRARLALFAPSHAGDLPTQECVTYLAAPLRDALGQARPGPGRPDPPRAWSVETWIGPEATRTRLARLMVGEDAADLLVTAGHGVLFGPDDPWQREHQGALVCAEWPGPGSHKSGGGHNAPARDHWFAAEDLTRLAAKASVPMPLDGRITFHFACYSGGTPRRDTFLRDCKGNGLVLARRPFVAELPRRLLGAGALAVVAHVDAAWPYSFVWLDAGGQPQTFESAVRSLMAGLPVGAATEYFGQRATDIALHYAHAAPAVREPLQTALHDARAYVILGDPAVRLPG